MTFRLLPLLPALLLPLSALASGKCTLTDPSLTLQSYSVNPQRERIAMYWKKTDGEAFGSLRALLADINQDGRVQMAMNGGIYARSYAPLGLYIEKGVQKVPLNRASGGGNFLSAPAGCFICKASGRESSVSTNLSRRRVLITPYSPAQC